MQTYYSEHAGDLFFNDQQDEPYEGSDALMTGGADEDGLLSESPGILRVRHHVSRHGATMVDIVYTVVNFSELERRLRALGGK